MRTMTDHNRITRCVKKCIDKYETHPGHTNLDCHMKQVCCCYTIGKLPGNKEDDNCKDGPKICCCVKKKRNSRSDSPRQKCVCCNKNDSPEREICKLCFCFLKDCICKEKSKNFSESLRPRKLCEDLPLYDEKSHLLGYIKKGAIIDEPFCIRSRDKVLENTSNLGTEGWPKTYGAVSEGPRLCMASCRYAEGVRRGSGEAAPNVPRWTTKSAFAHATANPSPARSRQKSPTNHKLRNPCACGK